MSGDYPAGAANDSIAPYNQPSGVKHLCKYCDKEAIEEEVNQERGTDEYYDEFDKLMDEAGLCRDCHEEQKADMYRD